MKKTILLVVASVVFVVMGAFGASFELDKLYSTSLDTIDSCYTESFEVARGRTFPSSMAFYVQVESDTTDTCAVQFGYQYSQDNIHWTSLTVMDTVSGTIDTSATHPFNGSLKSVSPSMYRYMRIYLKSLIDKEYDVKAYKAIQY